MAAGTAENLAEVGGQASGTGGASSAECASNTGKRGAASLRGSFCFQARRSAASPADTSGARLAGLPESCGYGGKSRGGGQAAPRHGRRVFCRMREQRTASRLTGEQQVRRKILRRRADQRHRRRVFCRVREQHRWAWNCIAARSVLFSSAVCAASPADTSGARQAGLPESCGRDERSCGGGRQNMQTSGTDGASSTECASNTGGRGAAPPRGQFCFQARCTLNLPRTRAAHG